MRCRKYRTRCKGHVQGDGEWIYEDISYPSGKQENQCRQGVTKPQNRCPQEDKIDKKQNKRRFKQMVESLEVKQ